MKKQNAAELVSSSTPDQMAKLLKVDPKTSEAWGPDDLRVMVRHQLSAPLDFDLSPSEPATGQEKRFSDTLTVARELGTRTFSDLYFSPAPPIELLKEAQKFFKRNLSACAKDSPEWKVAYLFYLLSIVVARIQHRANTSKLQDRDQLRGIDSALAWPWVDAQVRRLLEEGKSRITSRSDA
ncbi:MAG: hypothetical protein C5B50_00475 [Verrucomicrobia bacterium]|nr:MAG: hypothetical protein C5B50_00475 [Verrucomicrobiota bacterium]